MDGDKSLSDIARSVLVDSPDGDGRNLREKAGLLALLNLLGIVEAFYGEMAESASKGAQPATPVPTALAAMGKVGSAGSATPSSGDVTPQASNAVPPTGNASGGQAGAAAPGVPPLGMDNPLSMISGLARMLSGVAGQPQAGVPQQTGSVAGNATGGGTGSLLGGLDPALIASLLGLVSAMAKARPQFKAPTKVSAAEVQSPATAGDGSDVEFPTGPGDESQGAATEKPAGGQPPASPLQQILGIDPRVLTIILNLVADLMKNRPAETKDKGTDPKTEDRRPSAGSPAPPTPAGSPPAQAPPAQPAPAPEAVARSATTERRAAGQSPDAGIPVKEAAQPAPKRAAPAPRRYHRPGLGIYRSALGAAKPDTA